MANKSLYVHNGLTVGSSVEINGTSGNILTSGIVTTTNATNASSTITGALQVRGGAGIGGNLYVGGTIYGNVDATVSTATTIATIAQATSSTYYPTFVDSNNATSAYESVYTTSSFALNPSTGNVGVGTTPSSTDRLRVAGRSNFTGLEVSYTSGTPRITMQGNLLSSNQIYFTSNGGTTFGSITYSNEQNASTPNRMSFATSSTDRMIIDGFGNVGIGTTSPATLLNVQATGATSAEIRASGVDGIVSAHRSSSNASGPNFVLNKSRGNVNTKAAVNSGDTLGQISFQAFDGTNDLTLSFIRSVVDTYTTVSNISSYLTFGTSTSFGGAERMRIDSSGNVGIGTTSPQGVIHSVGNFVYNDYYANSTSAPIFLQRKARGTAASPSAVQATDGLGFLLARGYGTTAFGTNNVVGIGFHAAENFTDSAQGTYIAFGTTPTGSTIRQERVRLDASGNLGIGTSSPTSLLHVGGNTLITGITTVTNTTQATSTTTGALQVAGGAGVQGNLHVGGEIFANKLTIQLTTVTTTLIETDDIIKTTNATQATATATGALQIAGGASVGGNLWVGGQIFGNVGVAVATATNSLNVATAARTTNAAHFLAFVDSNNAAAAYEPVYTTSSFVINPATGNVGIGTTTPSSALTVQGLIAGTAVTQNITDTTTGRLTKVGDFGLGAGAINVTDFTSVEVNFGRFLRALSNATAGPGVGGAFIALPYDGTPSTYFLGVDVNGIARLGRKSSTSGTPTWNFLYGDNNISDINATTQQIFRVNSTERMRIDSSGNVGIGTTSPASKLDVNGDVTIADKIIHSGDTNTAIRFPAADTFTVETNGSERIRVTDAGRLGVGTSSPSHPLHVVGTAFATNDFRAPIFYDSDNTNYYLNPNGTSVLNDLYTLLYRQAPSGVPRSNLGDPSVTEMALFQEQFNNKTEFYPPSNVIFETSTDGTSWTEFSVTEAQKKLFVGGDSNTAINIAYGTPYFRVRFVNNTNYVYLNALYSYWSSNGHSSQVQIYKKKFGSTTWEQHTNSTATVGAWPGHLWLPFTTIPFRVNDANQYDEVTIVFIPTWNPTWSSNSIQLHRMQIWGGYPAGKRNIYSVDSDRNVTFPAVLSATTSVNAPIFYDSANTSYYLDPASTSNLNTVDAQLFENASTTSTRDKIRVYPSSQYAIGMQSGITYGGLSDWAMTFQMNNQSTRGFWWGDDVHSTAQGAMSLTTDGKLTVATNVRVGYGEATTTTSTFALDVNGNTNVVGDLTVSGTINATIQGITSTATNIAGGSAGRIPIQSGAGVTSFIPTGSNNQVLTWSGSTATWATPFGGATVDTTARTTNAAHYLTFVDSNNASAAAETVYTTSSFTVNPSTGNVGIGTSSPDSILTVRSTLPTLTIRSDTTTGTTIGNKGNRLNLWSASTTVGNGGEIVWSVDDTDVGRWAAISGHITGNSSGNAIGALTFATKTNGADTSLSERMRIMPNGNVGIGTNNPSEKLHITGGNIAVDAGNRKIGYITDATASNTGYMIPYDTSGFLSLHSNFITGGIKFHTGVSNTEQMRIDVSGNVLIGTTANLNSSAKFRVYQSTNGAAAEFYTNSTTSRIVIADNNNLVALRQNNGLELMYNAAGTLTAGILLNHSGNVGIGTTNPGYKLEVNGSFAAVTKSFVINHPTKPGMKLRYGSLEGPENGVYVRGRLKGLNKIELPDYWTGLVDEDTITVNLTPIGKHQKLYVEDIADNIVIVGNDNLLNKEINCFYTVFAERKDVDKLDVEI